MFGDREGEKKPINNKRRGRKAGHVSDVKREDVSFGTQNISMLKMIESTTY